MPACLFTLRPLRALLAVMAFAAVLVGCGEESAAPATSFCSEGQVVCKGNYTATCAGGTAWTLGFCGSEKYCAAGVCQPVLCKKGKRSCDGKDVLECPPNGDSVATKVATCAKNEQCDDGVCKPATCSEGDVLCGAQSAFVCGSGVWQKNLCGDTQLCSVSGKGCVARTCEPETVQCKSDRVAQTCSKDGTVWVDQSCAGSCQAGICVPKLASSSSKDASTGDAPVGTSDGISIGTGDTLVKPPKDAELEAPDVFKVVFSKTKNPGPEAQTLDMTFVSGSYLSGLSALQISGDDTSLNKIELMVVPIDDLATGAFTTAGGEAPETMVVMNDATFVPTEDAQWLWSAEEYEIYIDEFGEPDGGRIKGTFSAVLVNALDGSKAYLLDGQFDVARK